MGHPSRNKEDNRAEDDLNCGGPAQEVLEEKNVIMQTRDPSCNILFILLLEWYLLNYSYFLAINPT